MRGRALLFVLLASTLSAASGTAMRAGEFTVTSSASVLGTARDVPDAVVAGSVARASELARDLDARRDGAVWIASAWALAALGLWALVRDRGAGRAVARVRAACRTRAPPMTRNVICC
jgi:hypothetical protein